MIGVVVRTTAKQLVRDRAAVALTFVLPIAFFTIFAWVFSAVDGDGMQPVRTLVLADPDDPFATAVSSHLADDARLDVERRDPADADAALEAVRQGRVAAVVVLPSALSGRDEETEAGSSEAESSERTSPLGASFQGHGVEIHADTSNPLADDLVRGLVRAALAKALAPPTLFVEPSIRQVDVLGREGKRPSVAFFASGLGVLFLLFTMVGRSAIVIEEREQGVLGRLLATHLTLLHLLGGRWLFLATLGVAQVSVMFGWAAVVFGLDLFSRSHLIGFAAVTVASAAAAAAFGLLVASACRSRQQLHGLGVMLVLILCAVGGNLFPRFLMPASLQEIGRLTFNAWALDAYQKVFWYERPMIELWPQLAGLLTATVVFFALAYAFTRRSLRARGIGS